MAKIEGERRVNLINLDGPAGLIGAILRQAVEDARHPRPASRPTTGTPTVGDQLQAIEFLVAGEVLGELAGLIGLDPDWLQHELLREAGLLEGTPRLGERRRPRHQDMHRENPA